MIPTAEGAERAIIVHPIVEVLVCFGNMGPFLGLRPAPRDEKSARIAICINKPVGARRIYASWKTLRRKLRKRWFANQMHVISRIENK